MWDDKKGKYLATSRWRFRPTRNAIPMLFVHKKPGLGGQAHLRTVLDKCEQNEISATQYGPHLSNVLRHPHRTLIDGRDAFEQIRVVPEHVSRTAFTTPEGTMESLVMQQGDCNAPATYQSLVNHIFAPYIGHFMHVYLDDIIIFSKSVNEHLQHIRIVPDVLHRERLFLSTPDKLQFFAKTLQIFGHVKGIRMDPEKVVSLLAWKTPTTKTSLAGFLGAVGFLAPCKGICLPMSVLSPLTGKNKAWHWTPLHQCAFEYV